MKKFFDDKRIVFLYIFTIILLVIGTTYALQNASVSLGLNTALVRIDETAYGATEFDASNLEMVPILDNEVEEKEDNVIKIDFTVGGASTNNNDHIIYDIALADLEVNCNLLSPYLKWKLIKNGEELSSGSLDYRFDTIDEYGRLLLTTIQEDLPAYNASQTGYDQYQFYLWLSDSCQSNDITTCNPIIDQSNLMGQTLSGKIEVELYTEGKKELVRKPSTNIGDSACQNRYLVNFNTNGGNVNLEEPRYVVSGSTYGELPTPTRTDVVTFSTNGGSNITQVRNIIDKQDNAISRTIPKIKFLTDEVNQKSVTYTFDGWYKDKNLTQKIESTDVVNVQSSPTLYAKWSGDNTITLPSTSKNGYAFLGWYNDSSFQSKVGNAGDTYQVNGNKILYGKWEPRAYMVTYKSSLVLNGDFSNGTTGWAMTSYSVKESVDSKNAVRVTSTGQYTEGFSTSYPVNHKPNTKYRITLKAYRDSTSSYGDLTKDFRVYLEDYDASGNRISWNHYISINSSNLPDKTWTEFSAEFTTASNGVRFAPLRLDYYGVTGQSTIWVTDIKMEEIVDTSSLKYGSTYGTLPSNLEKDGYTFSGWYTEPVGGTEVTANTLVETPNDHSIYAHWEGQTYNLMFDATGGSISGGQTLQNLVTNGSFENGSSPWGFSNVSIVNGTAYSGSYSLSLSPNITAMSSQVLSQNAPTLNHMYYGRVMFKTPSGYTVGDNRFEWYYTDATHATLVFANKNIDTQNNWKLLSSIGSITASNYLSNTWALRNFTVGSSVTTYVDDVMIIDVNNLSSTQQSMLDQVAYFDGNNSISFTTVTSGSKYWNQLPTPTRTGYSFIGWYTYPTGGTQITENTIASTYKNHTLYARWSANVYTVTYNGNGATGGSTGNTSCQIGTGCTLTANGFSKTGYNFAGWATSAGGGVVYGNGASVTNLTTTNGGTVTLYAKWARNFTCAAAGGTTSYAGRSWYTLGNDGNYCTLALNAQSNITGNYDSAPAVLTTSFFTAGQPDYNLSLGFFTIFSSKYTIIIKYKNFS